MSIDSTAKAAYEVMQSLGTWDDSVKLQRFTQTLREGLNSFAALMVNCADPSTLGLQPDSIVSCCDVCSQGHLDHLVAEGYVQLRNGVPVLPVQCNTAVPPPQQSPEVADQQQQQQQQPAATPAAHSQQRTHQEHQQHAERGVSQYGCGNEQQQQSPPVASNAGNLLMLLLLLRGWRSNRLDSSPMFSRAQHMLNSQARILSSSRYGRSSSNSMLTPLLLMGWLSICLDSSRSSRAQQILNRHGCSLSSSSLRVLQLQMSRLSPRPNSSRSSSRTQHTLNRLGRSLSNSSLLVAHLQRGRCSLGLDSSRRSRVLHMPAVSLQISSSRIRSMLSQIRNSNYLGSSSTTAIGVSRAAARRCHHATAGPAVVCQKMSSGHCRTLCRPSVPYAVRL
jgi:hypothetical protein